MGACAPSSAHTKLGMCAPCLFVRGGRHNTVKSVLVQLPLHHVGEGQVMLRWHLGKSCPGHRRCLLQFRKSQECTNLSAGWIASGWCSLTLSKREQTQHGHVSLLATCRTTSVALELAGRKLQWNNCLMLGFLWNASLSKTGNVWTIGSESWRRLLRTLELSTAHHFAFWKVTILKKMLF